LPKSRWRIRLGAEAEKDFARILKWTQEIFGERQIDVYAITLLKALEALSGGPGVPGSAARDEILPGLRTLHVARDRRPGRHFIMYRVGAGRVIETLRILHDAMDLARHVPADPD
jgi:toxin ParE1/3/4